MLDSVSSLPLDSWVGIGGLLIGLVGVYYAARPYYRARARQKIDATEKENSLPSLRVAYSRQVSDRSNGSIIVSFENTGNGPIQYFTADIKSRNGNFQIGHAHRVTTSGIGGSWTVVSGTSLLPQERAFVSLTLTDENTELEPPEIKSDSQFQFLGESRIGPFVWHPVGFAEGAAGPPAIS